MGQASAAFTNCATSDPSADEPTRERTAFTTSFCKCTGVALPTLRASVFVFMHPITHHARFDTHVDKLMAEL